MKLLNQSLKHLSLSILAIVTIWAVIFYFNMLHEIKSSIDEGLENSKRLIIKNAEIDSSILEKKQFDESFFTVRKITKQEAFAIKDSYFDTILYMQDNDDQSPEAEPVRILTTAFEISGNYYELKVANSMVEEDDLVKELLLDVIWLYVILIFGIVFINNLVLRKLWKPFYDFLNQLRNYRLGNTNQLPKVQTNTKEFTDLNTAVNTLLQHSISTFENQKDFIGNASHELQTPLAIVTNKIELLLENEDLKEEQALNIVEIYQIIQRLIRVNKSLLLLSKIDNKQFFDNQNLSVNTIVHQSISELDEFISFKNIDVEVVENTEEFLQIDAVLANVIIGNLIKNAIFHNVENGKIKIEISNSELIVSNTGKLQALEERELFTRFQKSNSEASGTGLGLAIVKAITELYDYAIAYTFKNQMHCFEIKFTQNNSQKR